jgi:hypothetical protein
MTGMTTAPEQARPSGARPAARRMLACFTVPLAGTALAGLLAGLIWGEAAPRALLQEVGSGTAQLVNAETTAFIAADAWFCAIGAAAGLLTGLLGYRFDFQPGRDAVPRLARPRRQERAGLLADVHLHRHPRRRVGSPPRRGFPPAGGSSRAGAHPVGEGIGDAVSLVGPGPGTGAAVLLGAGDGRAAGLLGAGDGRAVGGSPGTRDGGPPAARAGTGAGGPLAVRLGAGAGGPPAARAGLEGGNGEAALPECCCRWAAPACPGTAAGAPPHPARATPMAAPSAQPAAVPGRFLDDVTCSS